MALDAESVVSHWSVMELTWTGATSSKNRRPSSPGVAFPSAVPTAPLPGFCSLWLTPCSPDHVSSHVDPRIGCGY